ncbi:hypothetical protein SCB71_01360 [Herbiconiux sp. KACC 21604]|uniref:hypothetical protein n=1 Tax=unclassified Herbiconiux TaxID=2618217 RepID=UPI001491D1E9|nr:hypothetical protein [Herbiconiux sp. SALV-R1]QJU55710.1 hypothetical protein HL652_20215 [Herbiconiux sp. SALV-R1]WPO86916.1 hypothetical protein SCB71_01360 [Herbiconiux sp. KACC 21604]
MSAHPFDASGVDPHADAQADAQAALEHLRMTVSPAVAITGPPERVDAAMAELDRALRSTLRFRPRDVEGSGPNLRLYRLGGRARWFRANLAEVLVSGGGGRFNISYHVVLERPRPEEVLLTVHGIDKSFRARYDPQEVFGDTLAALAERIPVVTVSDWFTSESLPPQLASSPTGFARWVGAGRAFWWG